MNKKLKLIALVLTLIPLNSLAVEIYDQLPNQIHADERYVIYSHGLIVEGTNPKPVHPTRGVYDFPAIQQALFKDGNFNLIAHQRPEKTKVLDYVPILESWVRRLVAAGVKPSRITIVGFSRGAELTAYASARLASLNVNTAIMGACWEGGVVDQPSVRLSGQVLSIYETSDGALSCKKIAQRSPHATFEEVAISTGREHGAFFRPMPAWVDPLKAWILRTNR